MPFNFKRTSLKRASLVLKHTAREIEEDKKFQAVYQQYGEAGLSVLKDSFVLTVLEEFGPGDAATLRLDVGVDPKQKRHFASFESFGVRYEITLVPALGSGQEHIWHVVASLRGRHLIREYMMLGTLREGVIALMNTYSPEGASMGDRLPGPVRLPDPTISSPLQVANASTAAFAARIADDYWFALDVVSGRVADDVPRAKQWLAWLDQYVVPATSAVDLLIRAGFVPHAMLVDGQVDLDQDFIEPPIWISSTVAHATYWWADNDCVNGWENFESWFVIPLAAQETVPEVNTRFTTIPE